MKHILGMYDRVNLDGRNGRVSSIEGEKDGSGNLIGAIITILWNNNSTTVFTSAQLEKALLG